MRILSEIEPSMRFYSTRLSRIGGFTGYRRIVGLVIVTFMLFGVFAPFVNANPDAVLIDTGTGVNIGFGFHHHVLYCNNKWYVLYWLTDICYKSSSDGATWSSKYVLDISTDPPAAPNGGLHGSYDFDSYANSTHIFVTWISGDGTDELCWGIYEAETDGTLTNIGDGVLSAAGAVDTNPSVVVDSAGYQWIARVSIAEANHWIYTQINTMRDGTWVMGDLDDGMIPEANYILHDGYCVFIPLPNRGMYMLWTNGTCSSTIWSGRQWNHTSGTWGSLESPESDNIVYWDASYGYYLDGYIHIAYTRETDMHLCYVTKAIGSSEWSEPLDLSEAPIVECGSITRVLTQSTISVVWGDDEEQIWSREFTIGGEWSDAKVVATVPTYYGGVLSETPPYSDETGFIFTGPGVGPNLYFDLLNIYTPQRIPNAVGHTTSAVGAEATFYANWTNVDALTLWRFGCNVTGSWVNTTWTSFDTTWTNVTRTLPGEEDVRVEYRFWVEDIYGEFGGSGLLYLVTSLQTSMAFTDLDDTYNLYAMRKYYALEALVRPLGDTITKVNVKIVKSGVTIASLSGYNLNSTPAWAVTHGGTYLLMNNSACSWNATSHTVVFSIESKWTLSNGTMLTYVSSLNDEATNSSWVYSETVYFINRLVTLGPYASPPSVAEGQDLTIYGSIRYAITPTSNSPSNFYPPNSQFTGVSAQDQYNVVWGTDSSIVNGVYNVTFSTTGASDPMIFRPYVNLVSPGVDRLTLDGRSVTVSLITFYISNWFIDMAGDYFGIANLFANFMSVMTAFVVWFTTAVSNIVALVSSLITLIFFLAGSIIYWFGLFASFWIALMTYIGDILNGTGAISTGFGDMWAYFSVGSWVQFVPIILTLVWFDSIQKRSRRGGRGDVEILIADIQVIMFIVGTVWEWSWTIFNFVWGTISFFISLLWGALP